MLTSVSMTSDTKGDRFWSHVVAAQAAMLADVVDMKVGWAVKPAPSWLP
jgi:hypothetical protein